MTEDSTRKTFGDWYDENKEDYNEARRQRYESDPEYREKVQRWNAQARERRKKDRIERRKKNIDRTRVRLDAGWKTEPIPGVGEGYTIGALSKVTGMSVQSLRLWERQGVIPETPYRDAAGARLYTEEQIERLVAHLIEEGKLQPDKLGQRSRRSKAAVELRTVQYADGSKEKIRVYKVAIVAEVIDRTVSTVSRLERDGQFPETPLRTQARGQRRYTYDMIQAVSEEWIAVGCSLRGKKAWAAFKNKVEKRWDELGLKGAQLID